MKELFLSAGDIVFMFTDGIVDSFETENDLEDFIKSITTVNPQVIAEEVLQKSNSKIVRDTQKMI